jgi:hypothetical protein
VIVLCFLQARTLAAQMLKQYSSGSQQVIQLKQMAFSSELVGKLETNLSALQTMYHSMQALILQNKNTDSDYMLLVQQHVTLAPSFAAHTAAAKALLQSAAPKRVSTRKV